MLSAFSDRLKRIERAARPGWKWIELPGTTPPSQPGKPPPLPAAVRAEKLAESIAMAELVPQPAGGSPTASPLEPLDAGQPARRVAGDATVGHGTCRTPPETSKTSPGPQKHAVVARAADTGIRLEGTAAAANQGQSRRRPPPRPCARSAVGSSSAKTR